MLRVFHSVVLASFFVAASAAMAAGDTLISMPGPTAGIAKSWKSAGPGKYEFDLDPAKKVKFDVVKKSLLKKKMITDVSGNDAKIIVSYKGDEKDFLDKVSKTKIKEGGDVDLAAESSVSDGGVRARTAARQPADGEVKGKIVAVVGTNLKVMAQLKGAAGVPADFPLNKPIEVAAGDYKGQAGQTVFFKPTKKAGEVWEATGFTDK